MVPTYCIFWLAVHIEGYAAAQSDSSRWTHFWVICMEVKRWPEGFLKMKQSIQIPIRRKQNTQTFSQKRKRVLRRQRVCVSLTNYFLWVQWLPFYAIKTSRSVSDLTSSCSLMHPWIIYYFPGQEVKARTSIMRVNIIQVQINGQSRGKLRTIILNFLTIRASLFLKLILIYMSRTLSFPDPCEVVS